jgi:ribosomal protein S18 acetylase RimI-like enzyme
LQGPVIRRAGPADAAALAAIGRATFTETFGHLYPPEDLEAFLNASHSETRAQADLADPARAAWLVEREGQVLGYALAGPCELPHPDVAAGDGELKRLYLSSPAQGAGLGERLMNVVMDWLDSAGPRTVWLGVWEKNFGAQRFYRRWGFAEAGTYDFPVGRTLDHELILRRSPEHCSRTEASRRGARHNLP